MNYIARIWCSVRNFFFV